MGGSLRFKVNENHEYMKRATKKLNHARVQSETEQLFNFNGGDSVLHALHEYVPNYAYAHYRIKNNVFNSGYTDRKSEDTLIAYSKISDPNSSLKKYFIVSKPEAARKYNNQLKVGSPRNITMPYPSYFGFGRPGGAWPRHTDAETMLLEELAVRFDRQTEAEIHLFTYLEPCLSCDHTISQFLEQYTEVDLYIYYFEDGLTCIVR